MMVLTVAYIGLGVKNQLVKLARSPLSNNLFMTSKIEFSNSKCCLKVI
jgi:hypothetical protein